MACPASDPYCLSCIRDICTACAGAYLNTQNGKCEPPAQQIAHCVVYNAVGECAECLPGYTPSARQCVAITDKLCAQQTSSGQCTVCFNGLQPMSGRCLPGKFCAISDCEQCMVTSSNERGSQCIKCKSGYSVQTANSTFNCVRDSLANCQDVVQADSTTCARCEVNYYQNNGVCAKSAAYSVSGAALASCFAALTLLLAWA